MPELPEVETVRRSLEPLVVGARVRDLWTSGKPLRLRRPVAADALARACVGRRIEAVRRRGKYLLVDVEAGSVVIVHLGMSGRLLCVPAATPRPAHTHVVFLLEGERELRFVDPRRFGQVSVTAAGAEDEVPELAVLGLDPLRAELSATRLAALARGSRRDVKSFLLDQSRLAGIGNIYACEALYRAGIDPRSASGRLGARRLAALGDAVRHVLASGIRNRGTSFRDYVDAGGASGGNQHALAVYGREREPCPRCGRPIRRIVQAGRSTFFCPRCQHR